MLDCVLLTALRRWKGELRSRGVWKQPQGCFWLCFGSILISPYGMIRFCNKSSLPAISMQRPIENSPRQNSQAPGQGLPAISFTYKSSMANRDSVKLPESVKSCFLRRSASLQEVQRFDIQNIIVRSTFTGCLCQLCETRFKVDQMAGVADCEHQFCKRCLHDYLVYKISVMEEVTCPQEDCPEVLDIRSSCYQDLPEEYKERYSRFLLWKQTISNPALRMCPNEDCKGIIDTKESLVCKACKTEFCKECMLVRHEGPCDANFQRNFKDWKRCPSCHMFIEKTEGCNHMTCLCRHEFCYVCLANWEERHYQCGSATDIFQGGIYRQYHFAQNLPRCHQVLIGILMIILTPLFLALAVGVLLLCVGLAAVGGALAGPCVVGCNTFVHECCCLWLIIFLVLLPIIMVVCAVGAAVKILIEGVIILGNVIESYFSTIAHLLCPPEEPDLPFDLEDLLN